MIRRIIAIFIIYAGISLAWIALGIGASFRADDVENGLRSAVDSLWGAPQRQYAPHVFYTEPVATETTNSDGTTIIHETEREVDLMLSRSRINIDIQLTPRRKGLKWYATYTTKFAAEYAVINTTDAEHRLLFDFNFPDSEGIFDDFQVNLNGKIQESVKVQNGYFRVEQRLEPGDSMTVGIDFASRGLESWTYIPGNGVTQVRDFILTMTTDFNAVDFPDTGMSPTKKESLDHGWRLTWGFSNLLTGSNMGLVMPTKLDPGPWVAKVSFAAPISLFFFFFILFILSLVQNWSLHPMHYFFIGCSFFSFHLLLAYLVDHMSIHTAFAISSAVSMLLVMSYTRLLVSTPRGLMEIGLAQLVYLIFFSYSFFYKGYTGLIITILAIVSLFVVMQVTAKMNWDEIFSPTKRQAM
ncbi:inner membrane CreD family protein [Desulfovibrio inopinatus]|uniref:inner membrane CreD family protein n=1 Tax=Desulfovibrio inopinatus TaxID=102109 RepID=UPI0004189718|nr:inner membrane CreD family protein [Desulfovibrio inopinatus]